MNDLIIVYYFVVILFCFIMTNVWKIIKIQRLINMNIRKGKLLPIKQRKKISARLVLGDDVDVK